MAARALVIVSLVLGGCRAFGAEEAVPDDAPDAPPSADSPASTTQSSPPPAETPSDASTGDVDPPPASPALAPMTRWHGALPKTSKEPYNKQSWCSREISFQNVELDVELDAAGAAVRAELSATAIDEGACDVPIITSGKKAVVYRLGAAVQAADGTNHIVLVPESTDHLMASLVVTGRFGRTRTETAVVWTRADDTPWKVASSVVLEPLPE